LVISVAGDDLLKRTFYSSLCGDIAIWCHMAMMLGLIPHGWKAEVGKIVNGCVWAGQILEFKEQIPTATRKGFSLRSPFQHNVSVDHGIFS
jgi:hypothetical protein